MINWGNLENLIQPLLDKNKKPHTWSIKSKLNEPIISQLNNEIHLFKFNTLTEKIFAIKNHLLDIPKCPCGNITTFVNSNKGYLTYCAVDCKYKIENQKNKSKVTSLEKYGFENASSNPIIKEKRKNTFLKNYKTETGFQNINIKNKIKNTFRANHIKYQLPERLEQIKTTYNVVPFNWDINHYQGILEIYQFQHLDCGKIFENNLYAGRMPKCIDCHQLTGTSKIELKLKDDLVNILGENLIRHNDRQIIKPKELDIVIDNKLAIEVNGSWWHREEIEKTTLLEKSNLSPIPIMHFWDYELENKYDICKSMIMSKLGIYDGVVGARQCEYKKVYRKHAIEFFNNNHLQGSSNSSIHYGLYYNDELIQCISIGKCRFNKNHDYEIHRLATKIGIQVIGGTSRLFSKIKQELKGLSIITYADKRYSIGKIYKTLGFSELKDSIPNYTWRKNTEIYPRYKTQKHKLKKLLKNFDSELTENQNMELNGYHKFSDCGNKVFTIKL